MFTPSAGAGAAAAAGRLNVTLELRTLVIYDKNVCISEATVSYGYGIRANPPS